MLPSHMTDPVEIAAWVEEEYMAALARKCRVYPPRSNRASELGHPCARYQVLDRTRGDEAEPPSPALQAIFEFGKIVERATVSELLTEVGLEWVWTQRPFSDDQLQVSGMLDGGIEVGHRDVLPAEIKSTQGTIFDSIRPGLDGLHDMLTSRNWMVRKWIAQIIIYLHLTGERAGMMVIRDKWFWRLRVVPVPADHEAVRREMARLVDRAKEVNEHIAAGTLPDRIEYSATLCGRCKLRRVCMPAIEGEGIDVVDDESLIAMMEERDELAAQARRYKEVDAAVKEALKSLGDEIIVGGRWLAKNTTSIRKRMVATGEEYETRICRITKLDRPLVPLRPLEREDDNGEG